MEHIDGHPHAFADAEGNIFDLLVFDGHDHELLNTIKEFRSAHTVICGCDNPNAQIGGLLFNGKVFLPKPYPSWIMDEENVTWLPPVPEPEQGYRKYYWDEDSLSWKQIEQVPLEE